MSKDKTPYIPETECIPWPSRRLEEVAGPLPSAPPIQPVAPLLTLPQPIASQHANLSPPSFPHRPPRPTIQPIVPTHTPFQTGGVSNETAFFRIRDTQHHAILTIGVLFLLLSLIALGAYLLIVLLPGLSAAPPS